MFVFLITLRFEKWNALTYPPLGILERGNKQTSCFRLPAETEARYDSDMNNCGDNEDK